RQGFPLSLGLALWERYTRDALAGLAGHAAYVLRYEELVAGPAAALRPLASWLGPAPGMRWDVDDDTVSAAAAVVPGSSPGHDGDEELPTGIRHAVEVLPTMAGPHDTMPALTMDAAPLW